jgi:carbon storage regulator CsrA
VVITIIDIDRGIVRLGIDAPRHVPVNRQEVLERYAPTVTTLDGPQEYDGPV